MKGSYKKATRRTHALARSPEILRTTQKYAAAAKPEVTLYTPEPEEAKAKSLHNLEAQTVDKNKSVPEHGDRRDARSTSTPIAKSELYTHDTEQPKVTSERAGREVDRPEHESERCKQTRIEDERIRQAAELANKLMHLQNRQKQLHNELDTMRNANSEAEAALQSAHANLRSVKEQLASQLQIAAEAESAKNGLKQRMEETLRAHGDAEEALAQAKSEIACLQETHSRANAALREELTSRISDIQKEKSGAKERAEEARIALDATKAELSSLQTAMRDHETTLNSCEAAKQRAREEVEKAKGEVERAKSVLAYARDAEKEKDKRQAEIQMALEMLRKAHEKAKVDLEHCTQKFYTQEASLMQARDELSSTIRETQKAKTRAEEQAKEARIALDASKAELSTAMRDHETMLSSCEAAKQSASKEVERANAEAESAKADLAAAREAGTEKDRRLAQLQRVVHKAAADAAKQEAQFRVMMRLEANKKQEARMHLKEICDRKLKEKDEKLEEQKQQMDELKLKVAHSEASWQSTYECYKNEERKAHDLEQQVMSLTAAKDAKIQQLQTQLQEQASQGARTGLMLSAVSASSVPKTDWSKHKYFSQDEFQDAPDFDTKDPKSMHILQTSFLLSYATRENEEEIHAYCGACRIHDLCELMHAPLDGDDAEQVSQSARQILQKKHATANLTPAQKAFLSHVLQNGGVPHRIKVETLNTDTDGFEQYADVEVWDVRELRDASQFYAKVSSILKGRSAIDFAFWDTKSVSTMSRMFDACTLKVTGLDAWNTAQVTNASYMFRGATQFDCDISKWDTSSLRDASSMFEGASSFNCGLSQWDTSKLVYTNAMFKDAKKFNGDVGTWTTKQMTNMSDMFHGASDFNCDLRDWETKGVLSMTSMFANARSFKGTGLEKWTVSKVQYMQYMFAHAANFDGAGLAKWDVSKVTTMQSMFEHATTFNADLSKWHVTNVKNMSGMFKGAVGFSMIRTVLNWNPVNLQEATDIFANSRLTDASVSAGETWIDKRDYTGRAQITLRYLREEFK
jgi:hypothetical protein